MNIYFPNDILLDEEAFINASKQLEQLSKDIKALEENVRKELGNLQQGFQTPAGEKFIESCETHLLKPLSDQTIVIEHVAKNLVTAKNKYETVFKEYKQLNDNINN